MVSASPATCTAAQTEELRFLILGSVMGWWGLSGHEVLAQTLSSVEEPFAPPISPPGPLSSGYGTCFWAAQSHRGMSLIQMFLISCAWVAATALQPFLDLLSSMFLFLQRAEAHRGV